MCLCFYPRALKSSLEVLRAMFEKVFVDVENATNNLWTDKDLGYVRETNYRVSLSLNSIG